MSTIYQSPTTRDVASHAGAEFFCQELRELDSGPLTTGRRSLLVAGCGAGHEAALIQRLLDAEVNGGGRRRRVAGVLSGVARTCIIRLRSVCHLPFAAASFDAVFYHHVIEHVDDPAASLAELSRVLKPGGWLFVGTPNRHRGEQRRRPPANSMGADLAKQAAATISVTWSRGSRASSAMNAGPTPASRGGELSGMLANALSASTLGDPPVSAIQVSATPFSPAVSLFTTGPLQNLAAPSIYVFAQKGKATRILKPNASWFRGRTDLSRNGAGDTRGEAGFAAGTRSDRMFVRGMACPAPAICREMTYAAGRLAPCRSRSGT